MWFEFAALNFTVFQPIPTIANRKNKFTKSFLQSELKSYFESPAYYTQLKMSQAVVVNFLSEQKRTTDKDLAAEWGEMEELYNEK